MEWAIRKIKNACYAHKNSLYFSVLFHNPIYVIKEYMFIFGFTLIKVLLNGNNLHISLALSNINGIKAISHTIELILLLTISMENYIVH